MSIANKIIAVTFAFFINLPICFALNPGQITPSLPLQPPGLCPVFPVDGVTHMIYQRGCVSFRVPHAYLQGTGYIGGLHGTYVVCKTTVETLSPFGYGQVRMIVVTDNYTHNSTLPDYAKIFASGKPHYMGSDAYLFFASTQPVFAPDAYFHFIITPSDIPIDVKNPVVGIKCFVQSDTTPIFPPEGE